MPNWKRVIVGDAFRLPSRDLSYDRDLFLLWPFLLFTVAAVADLFRSGQNHVAGFMPWALSGLSILLARERVLLVGAALGICALQSSISFLLKRDWLALAMAILSGTPLHLLIRMLKDYKPSYEWPEGRKILEFLIGMSSLGVTILVFRWFVH